MPRSVGQPHRDRGYGNIQFSKAPNVLHGMGVSHLSKNRKRSRSRRKRAWPLVDAERRVAVADTLTEKTCKPCEGGIPATHAGGCPELSGTGSAMGVARRDAAHRAQVHFPRLSARRCTSCDRSANTRKPKGTILKSARLGLCHDQPTDQIDQESAQERFHSGGEGRPLGRWRECVVESPSNVTERFQSVRMLVATTRRSTASPCAGPPMASCRADI
jgi:hypothetical protein